MTDVHALVAEHDLRLRRERVPVDAGAFAEIRANVAGGVAAWVSAVGWFDALPAALQSPELVMRGRERLA